MSFTSVPTAAPILIQPVKKGAFESGKGEKIETFLEPLKCRFIKLKAISEINNLPWSPPPPRSASFKLQQMLPAKDYWRGNHETGQRGLIIDSQFH